MPDCFQNKFIFKSNFAQLWLAPVLNPMAFMSVLTNLQTYNPSTHTYIGTSLHPDQLMGDPDGGRKVHIELYLHQQIKYEQES